MRSIGTIARGIRTPIIKANDDLANIVVDSLLQAKEEEGFEFKDKDIVAVTEAVVAIAENNYATVDDMAEDVRQKFPSGKIGLLYPMLSRNRFSIMLKGIARGCSHITIQLSFPSDEVGNGILDDEILEENGLDLGSVFGEDTYEELFSTYLHPFTGLNMVKFYRELVKSENCEVSFVFSNNPKTILEYCDDVLVGTIHTRNKLKKQLTKAGAKTIYTLDNILNKSINGSGYNSKYGLLGTNKATEEKVKMFPEGGDKLVHEIQDKLKAATGKNIEVMVYGDGCFKDSIGGIWELADPVVSPAYTSGLEGTPNEIKLKYVSDNKYADLRGEELADAIRQEIKNKQEDLKGKNLSLGTTPRKLTDLIGSLCDLTSGSGDKGTPVVYIQGYFDNYAS